jgi:hypothetical protein
MATEKKGVYTYKNDNSEKDYLFNFKTSLTAREKLAFVSAAVDTLYSGGLYLGIIKDTIINSIIIKMFTDIDLSHYEGEYNDIENFINNTNIIDILKVNIEEGLLDELNKQININLQIITGVNVNSINYELTGLVKKIVGMVNMEDYSNLMDFAKKINEMNGNLTPESIMNAYANYMYPDTKDK